MWEEGAYSLKLLMIWEKWDLVSVIPQIYSWLSFLSFYGLKVAWTHVRLWLLSENVFHTVSAWHCCVAAVCPRQLPRGDSGTTLPHFSIATSWFLSDPSVFVCSCEHTCVSSGPRGLDKQVKGRQAGRPDTWITWAQNYSWNEEEGIWIWGGGLDI